MGQYPSNECSFDSQAIVGHWCAWWFFWCVIHKCLYNQALADARSTGAEIKHQYCSQHPFHHILVLGALLSYLPADLYGLTDKGEYSVTLTHWHSERPKQACRFWKYFTQKGIFWKTFEGEMVITSQATTLLQIFCELSLSSQVIFKSMRVADDTFMRNIWVWMG